jgi:hypothetical protein
LEGRRLLSAAPIDTVGLYAPTSALFSLSDSDVVGASGISFNYGPSNSQWIPLVGDWTGSGVDTVGLYNPATSTFYLRQSNAPGSPDISFSFEPANSSWVSLAGGSTGSGSWIPLAGDWTGSGVDTVGLYDPATSTFYLRDSNTAGSADISFSFGPANSSWIPLAGDWTGSGVDTVGLYDPATATFYLRGSNTGGLADTAFSFGPANSTWIPLAGDWTGSGVDTVGLYDPATSAFYLSSSNSNTAGSADPSFSYGTGATGLVPLAGQWSPPVFLGLGDPALANLTQSLFVRDGGINRDDMLQILLSVGTENGGILDATDLGDLQTIVGDAATLDMPNYVQVLAGDVVDGNPANAQYQGQALGNLAVGSPASQLDDLVDKWFLGTDLPLANGPGGTGSFGYQSYAGNPLFGPNGPAYTDAEQGDLGDCYLISSLATVAKASPQVIENMFIDNGDGTYTVRFFTPDGTPDYVTVDTMLPSSGGSPVYEGLGAGDSLWLPLAEKAYAQWNQTGNEGRDGTNTYASIEGGWMSDVDGQVLGYSAQSFDLSSGSQQSLIAGVGDSADAVTIGTDDNTRYSSGLVGDHAYMVIGYNSASGLFQLYNPWGVDQPPLLSWNQLQANCDGFVVADTTAAVSAGPAGSLPAAVTSLEPGPARGFTVGTSSDGTSLPAASAESVGRSVDLSAALAPAPRSIFDPAQRVPRRSNPLALDWELAEWVALSPVGQIS